jgi:TP901 family phage tail tape measure protein
VANRKLIYEIEIIADPATKDVKELVAANKEIKRTLAEIRALGPKSFKELAIELKSSDTSGEKLRKRIEELKLSFQRNKNVIEDTNAALREQQKELKKTEKSARESSAAQAREIKKSSKTQRDEIKKTTVETKKANTAFLNLGKQILAAFGVSQVIRKVGEALTFVVEKGAAFEASLDNVVALSRATVVQTELLQTQAIDLGSTTTFTATQAAEAQGILAQAGFSVNEILAATPGVIKLAETATISLSEAADIAASALRSYGIIASELPEVNNLLARSVTSANLSVSDFGAAFKFAAPLANNLGIAIEDTAAVINTFANAGLRGTVGGTAFRAILTSLVKQGKPAQKAFKDLGVSTLDSNGNLRNFFDILKDLEGAFPTTTQLAEIFGKNAGAISILLAQGVDNLDAYSASLGRAGVIAENAGDIFSKFGLDFDESTERVETAAEKFALTERELSQVFTNLFRGISGDAASLGLDISGTSALLEIFAPDAATIDEASQRVTDFVSAISDPTPEARRAFADLGVELLNEAGNEFRNFDEILADIILVSGAATETQLTEIFGEAGRQGIDAITDLRINLGDIIDLEDSENLEENLKAFNEEFGTAFEGLATDVLEGSDAFRVLTAEFQRVNTANDIAAEKIDNLRGSFTIFLSALEGLAIRIFNRVEPALRAATDAAGEFINSINLILDGQATLQDALSLTDNQFNALIVTLSGVAGVIAFQVVSAIARAIQAIKAATQAIRALGIAASLNPIGLVVAAVAALVAIVVILYQQFEEVRIAAAGLFSAFSFIWERLQPAFQALGDLVANYLVAQFQVLKTAVLVVIGIVRRLYELYAFLFNFWVDLAITIGEAIADIGRAIVGFFQDAWDSVVALVQAAIFNILSAFGFSADEILNILEGIEIFFSSVWYRISNAFSEVMDGITNIFRGTWETIKNFTTSFLTGLKNLVEDFLRIDLDPLLDSIGDFFGSLFDFGSEAAGAFGDGFAEGVVDAYGEGAAARKALENFTAEMEVFIDKSNNLNGLNFEQLKERFAEIRKAVVEEAQAAVAAGVITEEQEQDIYNKTFRRIATAIDSKFAEDLRQSLGKVNVRSGDLDKLKETFLSQVTDALDSRDIVNKTAETLRSEIFAKFRELQGLNVTRPTPVSDEDKKRREAVNKLEKEAQELREKQAELQRVQIEEIRRVRREELLKDERFQLLEAEDQKVLLQQIDEDIAKLREKLIKDEIKRNRALLRERFAGDRDTVEDTLRQLEELLDTERRFINRAFELRVADLRRQNLEEDELNAAIEQARVERNERLQELRLENLVAASNNQDLLIAAELASFNDRVENAAQGYLNLLFEQEVYLDQLERLRRQSLITEEEFDQKRQESFAATATAANNFNDQLRVLNEELQADLTAFRQALVDDPGLTDEERQGLLTSFDEEIAQFEADLETLEQQRRDQLISEREYLEARFRINSQFSQSLRNLNQIGSEVDLTQLFSDQVAEFERRDRELLESRTALNTELDVLNAQLVSIEEDKNRAIVTGNDQTLDEVREAENALVEQIDGVNKQLEEIENKRVTLAAERNESVIQLVNQRLNGLREDVTNSTASTILFVEAQTDRLFERLTQAKDFKEQAEITKQLADLEKGFNQELQKQRDERLVELDELARVEREGYEQRVQQIIDFNAELVEQGSLSSAVAGQEELRLIRSIADEEIAILDRRFQRTSDFLEQQKQQLEEAKALRIAQLELSREEPGADIEAINARIVSERRKFNQAIADIDNDRVKLTETRVKEVENILTDFEIKQLQVEQERYLNGEISKQEFEDRKTKIQNNAELERLEAQIAIAQAELELLDPNSEAYIDAERRLNKALLALGQERLDNLDEEQKARLSKWDRATTAIQESLNIAGDLGNAIFDQVAFEQERRLNALEERLEAAQEEADEALDTVEEDREKALAIVEADTTLSDEEREREINNINLKYDLEEERVKKAGEITVKTAEDALETQRKEEEKLARQREQFAASLLFIENALVAVKSVNALLTAAAAGPLAPLQIITTVAAVAAGLISLQRVINSFRSDIAQLEDGGLIREGDQASGGGLLRGKRHAQGGIIIEAEDQEFVLNREGTQIFNNEVHFMNQQGLRKRKGLPYLTSLPNDVKSKQFKPYRFRTASLISQGMKAQDGGLVTSLDSTTTNPLAASEKMIEKLDEISRSIKDQKVNLSLTEFEEARSRRVRIEERNN